MRAKNVIKIALIGNPNVGKTSLFNKLTGLHQKVANYSGVTIDKKIGYVFDNTICYEIIDLPGIYSIYPSSEDEEIVSKLLLNKSIDKIIIIIDLSNIKRNLLLFRQIQDLEFPILCIINMIDEAKKKGFTVNFNKLKKFIYTDIILINARTGKGLYKIKNALKNIKKKKFNKKFINHSLFYNKNAINKITKFYKINYYKAWVYLSLKKNDSYINYIRRKYKIIPKKLQIIEIVERYKEIKNFIPKILYISKNNNYINLSKKIDNALIIHPFFGYIIFLLILLIIFQFVFFWSDIPRKLIEIIFHELQNKTKYILFYPGPLNNLITQAILPGIKTIITFIPQIFILLFFLLIMEESGYFNRVIFIMDKIMRPFGLSGKSIVPIISSISCAIPAIASSKHIENPRERLITILVTPFITCTARLPIYTLIISIIIPNKTWYFFNLRGLILLLMYLLGILSAFLSAMLLNKLLKKSYKSCLIMDFPTYKLPMLKNIFITLWFNIKYFIFHTGKIILLINIIIWSLGTFGPLEQQSKNNCSFIKENKLENSYLGIFGKKIEPLIRPLGYDWKIGIGILSSIVAREVFISTMNSIYEIGNKEYLLKEKMKKNISLYKQNPIYSIATGMSLLFFYAFSMQCTSTLSIIKKETKSWKWPIIQIIFMSMLAYFSSLLVYQILIRIL